MPMRLKVRTLPIENLIPAPYNPRLALRPGDRRYEKLARSLREFGLVEPLIWNETLSFVLNNLEAQGRYDPDKLADVLDGLADLPELELTGFDQRDLADLRLEPVDAPPADADPDRVEVTIVADARSFERFAPRLDGLVREFDLVCHVVKRI